MQLTYLASLLAALAVPAAVQATPALSTTPSASAPSWSWSWSWSSSSSGAASLDIPVTTAPPSWVTSVISSSSAVLANETTVTTGIGEGGGNGTATTKRTRKPHTEPIPIFTSQCACADIKTVAYPCWATDALQRCEFEELHSYTCNMINRGCPTPTRKCRDFFTATPVTGRHPCDIGFGNPPATATLTTDSAAPIVQPTIVEPGGTATLVAKRAAL